MGCVLWKTEGAVLQGERYRQCGQTLKDVSIPLFAGLYFLPSPKASLYSNPPPPKRGMVTCLKPVKLEVQWMATSFISG